MPGGAAAEAGLPAPGRGASGGGRDTQALQVPHIHRSP